MLKRIVSVEPGHGVASGPAIEAAAVIDALGPIADRLGSRGTVSQYEADVGDPIRTRAGTAFEGTTAPLPRFLPVRDIVRISFNLLEAMPPPSILQRLATSYRMPTDDNLMFTLPLAPSLRDALTLSIRYGNVALPWWRRHLDIIGDEARVVYRPAGPLGRLEHISAELTLVSAHRTVETVMGPKISQARINFAVPPISDPAILASRLGCSVSIGGDTHSLTIPLAALDWPSPYRDDAQWEEGLARCEGDLRRLQDAPLIGRIRNHVGDRVDRGQAAGIEDTASSLGMSVRSLVRALQSAGTTHHRLVDGERQLRARRMLAMSQLPLADIADRLGFPDQSNFGRKCKQWFGQSPATIRRQLRNMQH